MKFSSFNDLDLEHDQAQCKVVRFGGHRYESRGCGLLGKRESLWAFMDRDGSKKQCHIN